MKRTCTYSSHEVSSTNYSKKLKLQNNEVSCDDSDDMTNGLLQLIKYPCNECDHVATTEWSWKMHKETEHSGIKFPCDKCKYVATAARDLNLHAKYKHNRTSDKCDNTSTLTGTL